MTREDLITGLANMDLPPLSKEGLAQSQRLIDAAVEELSRSCAGCKYWLTGESRSREGKPPLRWVSCAFRNVALYEHEGSDRHLPRDGSGYCRPGWTAREAK